LGTVDGELGVGGGILGKIETFPEEKIDNKKE